MTSPNSCSCLGATTCGVSWIDDACADAVRLAALQPERIAWVVVAEVASLPADPGALFASMAGHRRTVLWQEDRWLLAVDSAATVSAEGPGRALHLAAAQAGQRARTIARSSVPGAPALPLWTTAWTFADGPTPAGAWGDGLAPATIVLPRRAWLHDGGGRGWIVHALPVGADQESGAVAMALLGDLSPADPWVVPAPWRPLTTDYPEQVEDAVSLISDGVMRKVVLARAVDESVGTSDGEILARLRAADAQATVYAQDLSDGGLFLGATPETLFTAEGSAVRTMALAGSCRRTGDEAEDLAAVGELLTSTKQRKEHGVVVEHVAAALRPRCRPLTVASLPHRRDADRLLHLETLFTAELRARLPGDYLDLLGALHPTPAVCGLPTATAAHYLTRHEHLDRGLYAGVLGWLTPDDARLVVPLRGGVLSPDRTKARLFAGAGIIETSDPATELAETELKLEAMRRAIRR